MHQFNLTARAIADPSRARALMMLRAGELCLCQIVDILALAPSTVSKHLSLLHAAGLVHRRKEGKWHYYRLPADPAPDVRQALQWVATALQHDPQVHADQQAVQRVQITSRQELCACYRS
jgi:DNA-binding transcriptional ArsR family regulator